MYAKSVHDRLQKLLRYAGTRAHPLPGTLAVLAILSVVCASVLFAMGEQFSSASAAPEAVPGILAKAEQPVSVHVPKHAVAPATVHLEDSRYQALAAFLARKYKVSERVIFNLDGKANPAGPQHAGIPLERRHHRLASAFIGISTVIARPW